MTSTTRGEHSSESATRWMDELTRRPKAADRARERLHKGPTAKTDRRKLDQLVTRAVDRERAATQAAATVTAAVERAHGALNIINPSSGHVNAPQEAKAALLEVAEELRPLGTTAARQAASYLGGLCQRIVDERQRYRQVMIEIATRQQVAFAEVEQAAHFYELVRYRQALPRDMMGRRAQLEQQMRELLQSLAEALGPAARKLLDDVFVSFRQVLAASCAAEWPHSRTSAVLPMQKRGVPAPQACSQWLSAAANGILEPESLCRR